MSLKDIVVSLNPDINMMKLSDSFASGGRSESPIIFSHDKKFLIKIISRDEKNIFVKLLPEFHQKMVENKTLLCRIYGLFRIIVRDKQEIYLIIMRNMNELPSSVTIYIILDKDYNI